VDPGAPPSVHWTCPRTEVQLVVEAIGSGFPHGAGSALDSDLGAIGWLVAAAMAASLAAWVPLHQGHLLWRRRW